MVESTQNEDDQASPADQTVSIDAALKLAEGTRIEEKVLGASLALRHHSQLLLDAEHGRKPRQRLRSAVVDQGATFLCRLLRSSLPLQRLALSLLRMLLAGDDREAEEVSAAVSPCATSMVEACAGAATAVQSADASGEGSDEALAEQFSLDELCDASDLLQRLLNLSVPDTKAEEPETADVAKESCRLLAMLLPGGKLSSLLIQDRVASKGVALAESLLLRSHFSQRPPAEEAIAVAESVAVAEGLRGKTSQVAALRLLASSQPEATRQVVKCWEEVISAAVGGGALAQHALLQLIADALAAHGLGLGADSKTSPLSRLKPVLVLAAGELRMGLEGYGSQEGLCAACMMLEAAIVALGKDAEMLESGNLEEVSNCLRELHRAVQDIFDFLADLPRDLATAPKELAMIARVVAAFQLEDPRQFSAEFQRTIWALCLLPPQEFQVLLPCLQELQDWQATPGFGKVLEVAAWGLEESQLADYSEVWRQCSMMLAEVALDAAVYLPEVGVPELLSEKVDLPSPATSSSRSTDLQVRAQRCASHLRAPRPIAAADPSHEGVQRLCQWSRRLWSASQRLTGRTGALAELALQSGSLLTSVPEEAALAWWPRGQLSHMWVALADGLLDGLSVEAATWRLSIRLAGFCLDRHQALAEALALSARRMRRTDLAPPAGALPGHDDEDEWALPDRAAHRVLQEFVKASADDPGNDGDKDCAAAQALDDMD